MLKAEVAVILRTNGAAIVLDGVVPILNPRQSECREPLPDVTDHPGIRPWPPRVVDSRSRAIPCRNLAERDSHGRMKFTRDVNAFAGGKSSVEVGGILEFEFGRTHFTLPSSVLFDSGSRGRSLTDPLSEKLPRKTVPF